MRSYRNKKSAAGIIEDDYVPPQHNSSAIQSSQPSDSLANGNSERQLSGTANEGESHSGGGGGDSGSLPPGHWLLTFEADGKRPRVQIEVTKCMMIVFDVTSVIASMLNVNEERVSLVVENTSTALHSRTPVTLLQHYYESDNLELRIASSHHPPISDCHVMDEEDKLESDDMRNNHYLPLDRVIKQQLTTSATISLKTDVTAEGVKDSYVRVEKTVTHGGGDDETKAEMGDSITLFHEDAEQSNTTTLPNLSKSNTLDERMGRMDLDFHADTKISDKAVREKKEGNIRSQSLLQLEQNDMNDSTLPALRTVAHDDCHEYNSNSSCEEKYATSPTEDNDDYSTVPGGSTGVYDTTDDGSNHHVDIDYRGDTDFNKTEETDFSLPVDALKRADFYEVASDGYG